MLIAIKLFHFFCSRTYPDSGEIPAPYLLDLTQKDRDALMLMHLTFANGVIVEMRAEGDCEEAIEFIRGLALGAGGCELVDAISSEEKERLWLYREGYKCYRQGSGSQAGYIFIDPKPQSDLKFTRIE